MATGTKAAEDVINDVVDQVGALCDRIITLRVAGNTEGSEELAREAETIISENLKGNRQGFVAARKTCRTGVTRAMETVPAVSSVEIIERSEPDWLTELVNQGNDKVRLIVETNVRGERSLAELMVDMRRRILNKDGLPDLKADSNLAKVASAQIYSNVAETLTEADTDLKDAIEKLQTRVRTAVKDVRVEYIRSLDVEGNEDAALFAKVERAEGQPLSEAVAKHYNVKLMTRAEIEAERRAAKAIEAGGAGGDGSTSGEDGESEGVAGALATIKSSVEAMRTMIDEDKLSEGERSQAAEMITALITELTATADAIN
jgi:hypothetical protein